MKKLFLLILLTFILPVNAAVQRDIKVGYGRISLIDLGTLITGQPVVINKGLVNVYELSGLDDESSKSIIAIQGLKKSGETDISVNTKAGVFSFHVSLNQADGEDIIFNPNYSRVQINPKYQPIYKERMTVVDLDSTINEFVLAGNPNIVEFKHLCDPESEDFLKLFGINSKTFSGKTDLVVATQKGVHKIKLTIQGEDKSAHTTNISLAWRLAWR